MVDILVLSASDVKKLLTMRDIIGAVEEAFRAYGKGRSKLAPVINTIIDKYNGEHEIKSGYVEDYCVGAKIVTYYKDNRSRHGLPNLWGVIVLNDLTDGRPLAVIDGTYITASRTGAAGAVAAKYLARKDSEKVGVIGAGTQGRYQVSALSEILKIATVKVYDNVPEIAEDYVREMSSQFNFRIEHAQTAEQAVQSADVIITATPATRPIILNDWIKEGVHINAIGADAPGKQELDEAIVPRAKVVVDNIAQCIERGEIQTAIRRGLLKKEGVYSELSDIVLARKPGRTNPKEITLFDATGMAVQDITTAYTVLQLAKKTGLGAKISIA
jgi:alanine dehydrogenase